MLFHSSPEVQNTVLSQRNQPGGQSNRNNDRVGDELCVWMFQVTLVSWRQRGSWLFFSHALVTLFSEHYNLPFSTQFLQTAVNTAGADNLRMTFPLWQPPLCSIIRISPTVWITRPQTFSFLFFPSSNTLCTWTLKCQNVRKRHRATACLGILPPNYRYPLFRYDSFS